MYTNRRSWFSHLDSDTCRPINRYQDLSPEPLERDDCGMEITAYLRCVIQELCSGATIECRRSEQSLHSSAREVDIGVHYPIGCREQFELALDSLRQHWSISETDQPVYLTFLCWGGQTYCVHIYDKGEEPSVHGEPSRGSA